MQRRNNPTARNEGDGLGLRSPHAIVGVFCGIAILAGWLLHDHLDLSPASGIGYLLGISGLSMMTLLLGYSLRKRARMLRSMGPIRGWFEWHLILGLLGPTLILYHAGFGLGSANANVSLACVLAVSGSGVGGRFLYGKMHRSLAGSRRSVQGMQRRAHEILAPLSSVLDATPESRRIIAQFEALAVEDSTSLLHSLRAVGLRPRARRTRRRLIRTIGAAVASGSRAAEIEPAVTQHLEWLCRAGELRLFERLFSLWHAIHVPLTILLFVSAALHVIAVHLY